MGEHAERIAKGSVSVLIASGSIVIVSFFFYPILVRLIDKESFGFYAILLAIYNIACPLVAFGLFNSVRKNMGEVEGEEKKKVAMGGFSLSLIHSVIALAVGLVIVILMGYFKIVHGFIYSSLLIIVISIPLFAIYEVARSTIYGLHLESRAEGIRILEKLVAFTLGLTLVYFGFGIPGIFLGIFISLMGVSILGNIIVKSRIGFDITQLKEGFAKYQGVLFSFGGLT
ncbi:MAG: oligosaccharide flippase family protein, partial [Thermoplasmata archaeon]